jgi:hypothetical protein
MPLSLYQMMFPQPQRPQPGFADQPQAAPPPSPQQRWWDMISARPQGGDPNASAKPPSDPYSALLNMTANMGWQGPQQPTNPPGQPPPAQPGQPSAYRSPQNALNIAQMGLGMLQPRPPYR